MESKAAKFYEWVSSFDIDAYAASSVISEASTPYLTYSFGVAGFGSEYPVQINLWTSGSEADANDKAEEICESIGLGGLVIPCDGGAIIIRQGSPLWFSVTDPSGAKHRVINISIEYIGD